VSANVVGSEMRRESGREAWMEMRGGEKKCVRARTDLKNSIVRVFAVALGM
jgi:hypothetical protein